MDISSFGFVTVAAADSAPWAIEAAEIVSSGGDDGQTLERAISIAVETGRGVYLYNGTYHIDSFPVRKDGGPRAAIVIPRCGRELAIIGQSFALRNTGGVQISVSASALTDGADVIRTEWCDRGIGSGSSVRLENISITLSNNRHAVRCIDLRRCDRPELKNIRLCAYRDMNAGLGNPPPIAARGCIGLTMTDGSNHGFSSYENIVASGFYEGIQVGGEHVLMLNCGTIMNYYGFTFGAYPTHCGSNHPITLIQCCDERNVCLPLFDDCGDDDGNGGRLHGGQEVTMISFNIERIAAQTPGGVLGDSMREVVPGRFCGRIEFTAQPAWCHTNTVDFGLWEPDGSGKGFVTRNMLHRECASTAERLSYFPTLGQRVYDIDLARMVICIDPENRVWVDTNGNRV